MQSFDSRLFLSLKLASVSEALGEYAGARDAFKRSLEPVLRSLDRFAETGEIEWADRDIDLVEQFINFCRASKAEHELADLRHGFTRLSEVDTLSGEDAIRIETINLRLLDFRTPVEVLTGKFDSLISKTAAEHGNLSQEVQKLYVDYAKFLHQRGFDDAMTSVILKRLETLTPGFKSTFCARAANRGAETGPLFSRLLSRVKRDPSSDERLNGMHASANTAYMAGDHETAFERHLEAAKAGHAKSQFSIGTFYQLGIGCEINMPLARKYYGLAAEQGEATAQHHLGALLQMGLGGATDNAGAFREYQRAAMQDYVPAVMNLAAVYLSSLIGPPQYAKGIDAYLRAYQLGQADALDSALTYFGSPVEVF